MLYNIVRMYFNGNGHGGNRRVILYGVTLEHAQKHCNDPESSSRTCKKPHNVRRTRRMGDWFDTYVKR